MSGNLAPLLMAALAAFVGAFLAEALLLGLARIFGIYAIVQERTCRVYMLFGKVLGVLDEPGLHFLPGKLGASALVVNFLGSCYVLDLRLDQEYLRSQPVPPQHEPDGAAGGHRKVAGMGLPAWVGVHPQGALPRCGDD